MAALLLLVFPVGFPNYDTIYALVWGRELAHGVSPDYGAALPPTPHPLADLLGLVDDAARRRRDHGDDGRSPTSRSAWSATSSTASARSGSTAGSAPSPPLIVLTRAPFLSNGLRAYVDLPYIALCLGALVIETKRPRAGWPVLALLVLAGLLRPEAWLFSFAYLALPRRSRPPSASDPRGETRHPSNGRILKAPA